MWSRVCGLESLEGGRRPPEALPWRETACLLKPEQPKGLWCPGGRLTGLLEPGRRGSGTPWDPNSGALGTKEYLGSSTSKVNHSGNWTPTPSMVQRGYLKTPSSTFRSPTSKVNPPGIDHYSQGERDSGEKLENLRDPSENLSKLQRENSGRCRAMAVEEGPKAFQNRQPKI